jgi:hypothetical protein
VDKAMCIQLLFAVMKNIGTVRMYFGSGAIRIR